MSIKCPYCSSPFLASASRKKKSIISFGFFLRKSDQTRCARFFCKPCKKHFSIATFQACYYQKKRNLNSTLFHLLVSGVSQRRSALILSIDRKTVVRKFIFLGHFAEALLKHQKFHSNPISQMQFDDLESFEHTKLKPISVILAVENKTRKILGFRVAKMPAKGLLAKKALKKYGPRADERKKARRDLFAELKPLIHEKALIESDENPHYVKDVKEFFSTATHRVFKGQRGCVVGQGELKAVGYDPLFSLNHTFAMLRANINRLFRKTWNTTKKPERLKLHINLYTLYHNHFLILKT